MIYPVSVFIRSAEPDADGYLYFNTFGRRWPTRRQRIEITKTIRSRAAEARAGRLGEVVVGWGGDGRRPASAVDTSDAVAMSQWFARAYVTDVRFGCDELIFADQEIDHARS